MPLRYNLNAEKTEIRTRESCDRRRRFFHSFISLTLDLADNVLWLSFRTNKGNLRPKTSPCSFKGDVSGSTGNHILNSETQFCSVLMGMIHRIVLPSVYLRKTSLNEITCQKKMTFIVRWLNDIDNTQQLAVSQSCLTRALTPLTCNVFPKPIEWANMQPKPSDIRYRSKDSTILSKRNLTPPICNKETM